MTPGLSKDIQRDKLGIIKSHLLLHATLNKPSKLFTSLTVDIFMPNKIYMFTSGK